MAELRNPAYAVAVSARSDALIVSTTPNTGVTALTFTIGGTPLPAFTGLVNNEKFTVGFNGRTSDFEMLINVPAANVGATVDVYINNNLFATVLASAGGFQTVGVIKTTDNVYLSLTSTNVIAVGVAAFQITARQTLKFTDYFAKTINELGPTSSTTYTSGTLAPTINLTNTPLVFDSNGLCILAYLSTALKPGTLTLTPTGQLATYYTQASFPNITFLQGIAPAIYLAGVPNSTVNVTGTLAISINNLNTPINISLLPLPFTGIASGAISYGVQDFPYEVRESIKTYAGDKTTVIMPFISRQLSNDILNSNFAEIASNIKPEKIGFLDGSKVKSLEDINEEHGKQNKFLDLFKKN